MMIEKDTARVLMGPFRTDAEVAEVFEWLKGGGVTTPWNSLTFATSGGSSASNLVSRENAYQADPLGDLAAGDILICVGCKPREIAAGVWVAIIDHQDANIKY